MSIVVNVGWPNYVNLNTLPQKLFVFVYIFRSTKYIVLQLVILSLDLRVNCNSNSGIGMLPPPYDPKMNSISSKIAHKYSFATVDTYLLAGNSCLQVYLL